MPSGEWISYLCISCLLFVMYFPHLYCLFLQHLHKVLSLMVTLSVLLIKSIFFLCVSSIHIYKTIRLIHLELSTSISIVPFVATGNFIFTKENPFEPHLPHNYILLSPDLSWVVHNADRLPYTTGGFLRADCLDFWIHRLRVIYIKGVWCFLSERKNGYIN